MALELTWAKQRRIMIIFLILVLFTMVFSAVYIFNRVSPDCFDGRMNGSEIGVDCGGKCLKICPNDTMPLVVDWVRLFKIREGEYAVLAKIENPNSRSVSEEVPYTFDIKDSSGNILTSRSGGIFVPSRKTFVVYEGTISSPGEPATAFFRFNEEPNWERSEYVEPDVVISDKRLTDEETLPRLAASIKNPNVIDLQDITLSAVIYDDEGNAVQVSQTFLEDLRAGASQNIQFTWPSPIPLKSRVCESPNDISIVIDRSGSMEYLGTNPPQPLTDVKEAADYFASELSKSDQASVVSFANEASSPVDSSLSADIKSVRQAIENISIIPPGNTQNTNFADGILKGGNELSSSAARQGVTKILVALTDGVATHPVKSGQPKYPETYALQVAKNLKDTGVRIFTIGLGKNINQDFLKNVASSASDFYLAPTADDLTGIYRQIGLAMCKRKPTALEIFVSIPPKD